MRTGQQFLDQLRDGRGVFADGERIEDVTAHPGLRGVAETIAELYDYLADARNGLTEWMPEANCEGSKAFMIPRSIEDLRRRRLALEKLSEPTLGFVGRGPDHVGGFLSAFRSASDDFDRDEREYGRHVEAFYKKVVREDLFVSYVIVPLQVTKVGDLEHEPIQVAVVDESNDGITVRGAHVLGTCSAVSDYLFVSCIRPLNVGDERHALSFAIPMGTPGLRLYLRRPYAADQPSRFDYPLTTRLDETDGLVVFEDVFVPWEEVFVYRDLAWTNGQFHTTAAHVLGNTQSQIRLVTKLKFLAGLGHLIAVANGIREMPAVQETLGELSAVAAIYEGLVLAAEEAATIDQYGVAVPSRRFLYAAMGLQYELYPRVLTAIRELSGQGLLLVPASSLDLRNAMEREDFNRYVRSPGMASEDRIKLFKLAWDAVGSEFGSRHHQYEMFYAGAPFLARSSACKYYGFDESEQLVRKFMGRYELEATGAPTVPTTDVAGGHRC